MLLTAFFSTEAHPGRPVISRFGPSYRALKRVLACAAVVLMSGGAAGAADLVAYTENLPPLNYEEDGTVKGFATELLRSVLAQAGLEADFEVLPWSRAYRMALARPDAILYSLVRTEERETLFRWIGPISKRRIFLFRRKERLDVRLKDLNDAHRYRIGVVREMAATQDLIRQGFSLDAELDNTSSDESNVRKLFANRVDLILALDWSAYYQARQLGHAPEDLVPVLLVDDRHSYYFGLSRDSSPALAGRIDEAFQKLRAAGELDRLRKKYLPQ